MAMPTTAATGADQYVTGNDVGYGQSSSNPMANPMTNTAIGQLLYSLNYKDPFDAANKYLGQIQGTISPYYNPYIKTGKYALGKTTGAYNKYMTNPADVINQLGQGYTASPGYQYNVDQATNAANQAGAAGGMVGTPQEQQQLASVITGLSSQDYDKYMQQVLGVGKFGAQGMQEISNQGYQASSQMAQDLAHVLLSQAMLSYKNTMAQNQQSGGLISGLTGAVGL
jgi:hypothetical protein